MHVQFKDLTVTRAVDGEPGDCDNLEIYQTVVTIWANGNKYRNGWYTGLDGSNNYYLSCGFWPIITLAHSYNGDTISVHMPVSQNGDLQIHVWMYEDDPSFGGDVLIDQSTRINHPYSDWYDHTEELNWEIEPGSDISGSMHFVITSTLEKP